MPRRIDLSESQVADFAVVQGLSRKNLEAILKSSGRRSSLLSVSLLCVALLLRLYPR